MKIPDHPPRLQPLQSDVVFRNDSSVCVRWYNLNIMIIISLNNTYFKWIVAKTWNIE